MPPLISGWDSSASRRAQDERCVWNYRRDERGEWRHDADVYRDGQTFELPTLAAAIAVGEVYDGILDAGGRSLLR